MARPAPTSAFSTSTSVPLGTPLRFLPTLLIALAGWLVWHRALDYYFSQDDFSSLARTVGLLPRLEGPWRAIGNQLIFDLLHRVSGLSAAPYHAASIAIHLSGAVLLYRLLEREVSRPAAFTGAVFFVTHPALFSAVYWISAVADGLALLFALAALLALRRTGVTRWLAVPLFVLSLLSKESTVLLPVAAVLLVHRNLRRRGAATGLVWRDPLVWSLAAVSALYLGYFWVVAYARYFVPSQAQEPASPAAAYAIGLGPHLWQNALSLVGWSVNLFIFTVRGVSDAVDPAVFPWAVAALLGWSAGLALPALRRRGWIEGGALFGTLLLPVLPLHHHTYHYYLDAPLAGAAWCVAALVDAALARVSVRRAAGPPRRADRTRAPRSAGLRRTWAIAGALAAGLTLNGFALVRKIETHPFVRPELRSDPVVDRALIAQHARDDLQQADLPAGTRLAFWFPQAAIGGAPAGSTASGAETYWERNVRNALLDGLAIRILRPEVREVRFVRTFTMLPAPWRYAVYRVDGHLRVGTSEEVARGMGLESPSR
jgi:hypothetical protein